MERFDHCDEQDLEKLKPFEFDLDKNDCLEIISANDEDPEDKIKCN